MTDPRKTYDATFKRETVEFADHSEKSDRIIEQELGIYQGALRLWRQALRTNGQCAPSDSGLSLEEENRRLRRELADMKTERDILKKAMAIFTTNR